MGNFFQILKNYGMEKIDSLENFCFIFLNIYKIRQLGYIENLDTTYNEDYKAFVEDFSGDGN